MAGAARYVLMNAAEDSAEDSAEDMFPVIVVFAVLIVGSGRTFAARNEVTAAAHSGARAGSIVTNGPEAAADVEARRSLTTGSHCVNAKVETSIRTFDGIRMVHTTVTCTIRVDDLGLPFHQTVTASAEEAYDHDHQ